MVSPMNSSRIGCVGAGRIEVDDAAADAELAGLVDGILARIAGGGEPLAEIAVGEISWPGADVKRGAHEPIGRRCSRGSSAGADAIDEPRGARRVSACRARARADAMSRCGARPRYGSTSCDGNGSTARSASASDSPSSAARKNRASAVMLLDVGVGRHDQQRAATAATAALALAAGVRPETPPARQPSRPAAVLRSARSVSELDASSDWTSRREPNLRCEGDVAERQSTLDGRHRNELRCELATRFHGGVRAESLEVRRSHAGCDTVIVGKMRTRSCQGEAHARKSTT